jgi:hypothetical protein
VGAKAPYLIKSTNKVGGVFEVFGSKKPPTKSVEVHFSSAVT